MKRITALLLVFVMAMGFCCAEDDKTDYLDIVLDYAARLTELCRDEEYIRLSVNDPEVLQTIANWGAIETGRESLVRSAYLCVDGDMNSFVALAAQNLLGSSALSQAAADKMYMNIGPVLVSMVNSRIGIVMITASSVVGVSGLETLPAGEACKVFELLDFGGDGPLVLVCITRTEGGAALVTANYLMAREYTERIFAACAGLSLDAVLSSQGIGIDASALTSVQFGINQ